MSYISILRDTQRERERERERERVRGDIMIVTKKKSCVKRERGREREREGERERVVRSFPAVPCLNWFLGCCQLYMYL